MILKYIIAGLITVFVFGLLVVAQQMPSGAVLRGKFVYEDTGRPLRRAWVGLKQIKSFREEDSNSNSFSNEHFKSDFAASNVTANSYTEEGDLVLTNDNGEYVLKGIEPGIYFPYVKQQGIYNPDVSDGENPAFRQITIVGNEEIDIDFAVKRGGSIEGKITYQDGSPALGVAVSARLNFVESSQTDMTSAIDRNNIQKTDDRGIYRFAGLGAGEYTVYVTEPVVHTDRSKALWDSQVEEISTTNMLRVFYPGGYSASQARPVPVRLGQDYPNTDIVIPDHPFATLTGVVISAKDKSPLPGYSVRFSLDSIPGSPRYRNAHETVMTDENGRWEFSDLLPGKYQVTATFNDERFSLDKSYAEVSETSPVKFASLTKEIEVVEGVNGDIVFELVPAGSISGVIEFVGTKTRIDYLFVFISAEDEETGQTDTTIATTGAPEDTTIRFKLEDTAPGNYSLNVTTFSGPYLSSILLNNRDITNSKIQIAEGESIENVRILLGTDFGGIKGRVSNNFIPPNRYAYLVPFEFSESNFLTDMSQIEQDGKFELSGKPGRYYLVTKENNFPDRKPSPDEIRRLVDIWVKNATVVELKAYEISEITIRLD